MWLIVGLGNKGSKYLITRHNIGFMAVDAFAQAFGQPPEKSEHKAITRRMRIDGEDVLLAKPQTFMNLSGESVQALSHFYKIPPENILVVHDDIDQGFGAVKFQKNRGAGGHNGIKSVTQMLGTNAYPRLKLGVGRPANSKMDVAAYVLQNFSDSEQSELSSFIEMSVEAIEAFIFDGFEKAANKFNSKKQEVK